MPRRTRLVRCGRCKKKPAVIGAFTSYYVLRHELGNGSGSPTMTQTTGSLPARGYCRKCFVDFAKDQELDYQKMAELREKLDGRSNSRSRNAKVRS
jgi:hypothetical protein